MMAWSRVPLMLCRLLGWLVPPDPNIWLDGCAREGRAARPGRPKVTWLPVGVDHPRASVIAGLAVGAGLRSRRRGTDFAGDDAGELGDGARRGRLRGDVEQRAHLAIGERDV